ncbi:MAG: hypothetical protein KatS3mg111_3074 [Pirellulaceae bacterium]|nr:MAG: hypothetical protein KatS3mg111_3074 [Pirellulaceae bacterium]
MSSLRRAVAVLGAVSFVGTATQVAKGKIGALLLGAAGVGVLNQLTTVYSILFIVAGLGFFNGMIHRITIAIENGDSTMVREQINSVLLFLCVTSLLVVAGCFATADLISDLLFADGGERAAYVRAVVLAVPIAVLQRVFRAYLSAKRDLKALARAQTAADVSSVLLFAVGVSIFGIWGAVCAFVSMHALLLMGMATYSVRSGGVGLVIPRLAWFRWREIAPNFGYGVNALIATAAASGVAIIIGRLIIAHYGLAAAGIFAVASKVATVYLGALYSAASSYYFPTLIRAVTRERLEADANAAVALYMTILPLAMLCLIALGDILIPLLFSEEFRPAVMVMAGLLLGDIFRVTSETIGLTMLARQHLTTCTMLYLLYSAGFVLLSWWLLPEHGLLGVAYAYLVMRALDFVLILLACRMTLDIGLTSHGMKPLALAFFVVAPMVVAEILQASQMSKIILAGALSLCWVALGWNLPEQLRIRQMLIRRLASQ